MVRILFEFVALCVDWERVILPGDGVEGAGGVGEETAARGEERKKEAVRNGIELLVEAAMRSGDSKEVKDKVDADRAGIVMFRLP